ncbi:hypothetical protein GRZ09_004769 [Salmonella enterica]|nr:hypothetical protein [Salmonella enterica]
MRDLILQLSKSSIYSTKPTQPTRGIVLPELIAPLSPNLASSLQLIYNNSVK